MGILSFQKIYGLYGLKHHTVDLLSCRFLASTDGRTNEGNPRGPRGPKNSEKQVSVEGDNSDLDLLVTG